MKRERVRERKTGKVWREEAEWEQTTSSGQIQDTEKSMRTGGNKREKQRNTSIGRSVAFPWVLPTAWLTEGDDSVYPLLQKEITLE